jgi:hypothetical protein
MPTKIVCPKQKKIQNNLQYLVKVGLSLKWNKKIVHKYVVTVFPDQQIKTIVKSAGSDRFLLDNPKEDINGLYIQSILGVALEQDLLIYLSEDLKSAELLAIHLDHNKKTGTVRSIEIKEEILPFKNPSIGLLKRLIDDDDSSHSLD